MSLLNATSINANFPVGQGVASVMTIVGSAIVYWMYFGSTVSRISTRVPISSRAFQISDLGFFGIFLAWGMVPTAIVIWALYEYSRQYSLTWTTPTYLPQDISNFTHIGLCMGALYSWVLVRLMIWGKYGADALRDNGTIKDEYVRNDVREDNVYDNDSKENLGVYYFNRRGRSTTDGAIRFFGSYFPLLMFIGSILFDTIFGFLQAWNNTTVGNLTYAGGWFNSTSYASVPQMFLVCGILLFSCIVIYLTMALKLSKRSLQLFKNMGGEMVDWDHSVLYSIAWVWLNPAKLNFNLPYWIAFDSYYVGYQTQIFGGSEGPRSNKRLATLIGWIPTVHIAAFLIIAHVFWQIPANLFVTYDMQKAIYRWFCCAVTPLMLALLGQSFDLYIPFYFICEFVFLIGNYWAGAVATNPANGLSCSGVPTVCTGTNLDYAYYLSGPPNVTDPNGKDLVNPWDVYFFMCQALGYTILAYVTLIPSHKD